MKQVATQFVLFAAVGTVGTAAHFAVLILLVRLLATGPVSASVAGFVTGALVNYGLNYHVTFRSRNPHTSALPKFLAVALAGLCLNTTIMAQATAKLHYLFSQALATAVVLGWNFVCNRIWTFREGFTVKRRGDEG